MNKNILAHLAVIGANVIYGINYVVAKGIMPDFLEPRPIILLRALGATSVFWIAGRFFKTEKVERRDLYRLAICGLFGIAINQIMFFEGLNLSTPINASIIMVSIPILVMIMAHFIIGDRITRSKLIGIGFGVSGAMYLILKDGVFSFGADTVLGNIFVLINASCYALFLVLVKPLMVKYSPITLMKWAFLFGLIFIIPVSIVPAIQSDFSSIPGNIWISIIYVIIFTTIFTYFLNNYSLKTISPSVNSIYIYTQPILATIVALAYGKDHLSWSEVIAAVLIFIGVYFVSRRVPGERLTT